MSETKSLKALADAVYRRDTVRQWRDGGEKKVSQPRETSGLRISSRETPGFAAPAMDYEAVYSALAIDAGTAEDLAALARHVGLNGFWVAEELKWMDQRCDRLARDGADEATYRAAVLLLVARVDELRRWAEGTAPASPRRRLNVMINAPVAGPVTLPDGTLIEDVGRFIGRLLTAVDYVLGRSIAGTVAVLSIYLEQLAELGITAHVEAAQ